MNNSQSRHNEEDPQWWEHLLDDTDPPGHRSPRESSPEHDEFEDLPEEYVPPEPPPFPIFSPQSVLGFLAAIAGLATLIWPDGVASWLNVGDTLTLLIGLALLFAGAIALVLRLRPGGEDDDTPPPPDEGAVV